MLLGQSGASAIVKNLFIHFLMLTVHRSMCRAVTHVSLHVNRMRTRMNELLGMPACSRLQRWSRHIRSPVWSVLQQKAVPPTRPCLIINPALFRCSATSDLEVAQQSTKIGFYRKNRCFPQKSAFTAKTDFYCKSRFVAHKHLRSH